MDYEIDLSDAKPFESIPEGIYIGRVCDAKPLEKNKNGNIVAHLKFEIVDAQSEYSGRQVKSDLYFTEKALSGVVTSLINLGFTQEELNRKDPKWRYDHNIMLGRTARIKVIQTHQIDEETNEVTATYNQVKSILPLSSSDHRLLLG